MNTRRGLGRGLGALIPTSVGPEGGEPHSTPDGDQRPAPDAGSAGLSPAHTAAPGTDSDAPPAAEGAPPVAGAHFADLPVGAVHPNPRQPRQSFDEDDLAELALSIREVGLLQPVVVRPVGDDTYELVMGERRWRAVQEAGLESIPAIVRDTPDDAMLRDALLENLHRSQLNPLEEAAAYQQLLDDFGCTHDELAGRIGRSRPQITNTLRLLRLNPAVQRRVAAGVLSAGHARALVSVADGELQDRLALRVVAEGLSVRALEELVTVGPADAEADGGGQAASGADGDPRLNPPVAPHLTDLADRLSERFETRVKVDLGRRKGRITVEFATIDDLDRIVHLMDPRD
ncbi:MAG: ParB/RepB/Spo0J family partition protein [Nocardioidaceae bacterium]|nr:ParB/RepB/Spo0J family partition protein [Nocardioidaceae bacterium]